MIVSTDKTMSTVISKDTVRCELEIGRKVIEQVVDFQYLGTDVSVTEVPTSKQ